MALTRICSNLYQPHGLVKRTLFGTTRQSLVLPSISRPMHQSRQRHLSIKAEWQLPSPDDPDVSRILQKYTTGTPSTNNNKSMKSSASNGMGDGLFTILLLNFGLFAISHFWNPSWAANLCLNHYRPHWYQFITATFMHYNWEHLIGNAFSLLVFGRMVEEEEGALGVWMTYILCGVGGCIASYLSAPHTHTMSLGASSAVFGLFMVGVLTKLRPSVKRLMEAVILGSFVTKQVLNEVSVVSSGKAMTIAGGTAAVGHWAHLGGALAGVLLVVLLSRLPAASGSD